MSERGRSQLPEGVHALVEDAETGRQVLAGGVRVLQVRIKRGPSWQALEVVRSLAEECRARGAICLVNDRPDWALVSGAGGVHVGENDLSVADARRILGPSAVIGATVRDLAMAERAFAAGADYVGLGPIFATSTKEVGFPPLGLEGLRWVAARARLPVVAVAGIGLANIEQVAAAGAHGAAVLSDLLGAPDIAERARQLCEAFERGRTRRSLGSE